MPHNYDDCKPCYKPCKKHYCDCCCCKHHDDYRCSELEIFYFLGKETYKLLSLIPLPPGHPSLDESLCALINGKPLPPGHPTVDDMVELLKKCL